MSALFHNKHSEDILSLTPNSPTAMQAIRLAAPQKWADLGQDDTHLWGKVENPDAFTGDIFCAVDWPQALSSGSGMACNCGHGVPCEHTLALLLLLIENSGTLARKDIPDYARNLLSLPPSPSQTRDADLDQDIRPGLGHLERWLSDLIRLGLGEPQVKQFAFWDDMADRMFAARMPGLAQWLRDIANLPVRGGDWVEPLLGELGRMFLLVRSFERYEELSDETQADLRAAIGWQRIAGLDTAWREHWLVLGQQQRLMPDKTPEQLIWLYSLDSKRPALLHQRDSQSLAQAAALVVGQAVDAVLSYLPSRAPLEALFSRYYADVTFAQVGGVTIQQGVAMFGQALSRNPWLKPYPLVLDNVYIMRFDRGWIVRHADGTYLPVAPYFPHKWALYGLSGGHSIQLAATWNGHVLYPLSINIGSHFFDLHTVIPYK